MAEYLYYAPGSCNELLGFRGVPSALSPLPPRRRPRWDLELVARDSALDRLRHLTHDTLLVGIPGSGNTSLLSRVSAENRGLFARTADRDRLAPDLREHRPKAVFVDGLDEQLGTVQALVSLREESGVPFNIVVTAWHEDDAIIELLGLGSRPQNSARSARARSIGRGCAPRRRALATDPCGAPESLAKREEGRDGSGRHCRRRE